MQAALPLMVAGSLLKGVAGFQAGQYNADVLGNRAHEEELLGQAEQERIRMAGRAATGKQAAGLAESGFTAGVGSARTLLEESLIQQELDISTSRRNATGRAAGLRSQAKMQKRQAVGALVGSAIGAASTIAGYKADYASAQTSAGGGNI